MPEKSICIHCRRPIDPDEEDYVVTNKDKVKYENQWLYAHVECQAKNPT